MSTEDFRVDVVLADVVRRAEGKLDCLGIGWQVHTLGANIGLGVVVEVPWNLANVRHNFSVTLEDDDGGSVLVLMPDGTRQPFMVTGQLEVGRPPGVAAGTPFCMVAPPINFGPGSLPLEAGKRYTFTVFINEETLPQWQRSFGVQHPPMQLAS